MQHAVIQFREKQITRTLSTEEQTARGLFQGYINETKVLPYLMDLESTNKTFLNGSEVEGARYYELRDKDILRFGESQREYVIMKK
jgi:smad nuclear-interacting protein 1